MGRFGAEREEFTLREAASLHRARLIKKEVYLVREKGGALIPRRKRKRRLQEEAKINAQKEIRLCSGVGKGGKGGKNGFPLHELKESRQYY